VYLIQYQVLLRIIDVIKPSVDYLRKGAPFPQSGYDELDSTLIPPRQDHYRITPSPGGPVDRYGMCNVFIQSM
jgi:hypothetical protein